MRRDELKGVLLDHAVQHGLSEGDADRMAEEVLKRFKRLFQEDYPGAS